jgi:hypothetical protein
MHISAKKIADGQDAAATTPEKEEIIETVIRRFITDLNSISLAYPLADFAIGKSSRAITSAFAQYLTQYAKKTELEGFAGALSKFMDATEKSKNNEPEVVSAASDPVSASLNVDIPPERSEEFWTTIRNMSEIFNAGELVSRSFVLTMVSQFDAFVGGMIRSLAEVKPDVLSMHSKAVTFSEIIECGSIDVLKTRLIDQEIESVLRNSHSDHFDWLERKFEIPLRKSLKSWPTFIELTERRNLFAHGDGRVSAQYIAVCKKNEVVFSENVRAGKRLVASKDYIERGYSCLYEIGFKLGQVLWRKVVPGDQLKADKQLIAVADELMADGKYELAEKVLSFFLLEAPTKGRKESERLLLLLRLAEVRKWKGDLQGCKALLATVDWSAAEQKYQFTKEVLSDEFSDAAKRLKAIDDAKYFSKVDFARKALFKKFRNSSIFLKSYKSVFGEDFEEIKRLRTKKTKRAAHIRKVDRRVEKSLPSSGPATNAHRRCRT